MVILQIGNKRIWFHMVSDWLNPELEFIYFRVDFHFEANPFDRKIEGLFLEVGFVGMRLVLGVRIK